ncbi:NAD(P)-dependent oxidoreductase [Frankia sp. Cpl3]|nr:NAD(P)-dependent oxidoreductase [Parafrankia colletiae]MCK9900101.1 NAD(P)-dependent oxidoreductase [Frankia sp. Cpl3]
MSERRPPRAADPAVTSVVGFIGLGSMGSVLAHNLVEAGHVVVCHDLAGADRAPAGASFAASVGAVAAASATVVLSLPDGLASAQVVGEIVGTVARTALTVVETSTIGVVHARNNAALLETAGMGLVDAPVSGGVAGARSRTLTVMYSGDEASCARAVPVLAGLSDRRIRVGDRPGLAQAMKLANNYLSATALAATSEAIAFGTAAGLSMTTMLDVLNTSSGQNSATSDKFPNHVLTGGYAAGFANSLMAKDVGLYLDEVAAAGGPDEVGRPVAALWRRFADQRPGADFTAIYPFVAPEDAASD